MGAWGINPFEYDEGLDVKERWNDWINGYEPVGYDEAIKRFFNHWGDAVKYGDSITNNEIIALVALHLESNIAIPKVLFSAAEGAINRELETSELGNWQEDQREAREEFLSDLLVKIGGKRKTPKKSGLFFDPALHFRSTDSARNSLVSSFNKLKNSKVRISLKKAGLPSFVVTLDRFMNNRVWEKDSKIYLQATRERLMMLATYIAIRSNFSEDELIELLDKIEKKKK